MQIQEEINRLGHLKPTAEAIIAFVSHQSIHSKFEHTSLGEWALKPDNWIALKFTHQTNKVIHISLGVYRSTIDADGVELRLKIKNGRFPNWSKVSIYDSADQDSILKLLKIVYLAADNKHRNEYGRPALRP
jgi:hypothetical protein